MYRKVKFSLEFKKECLDLIILNHRSLNSVSNKKGVSKPMLCRWKDLYESKGLQGLIPKKTKAYSASFKLENLNLVSKNNVTLEQLCIDYNIRSSASIIHWKRQ